MTTSVPLPADRHGTFKHDSELGGVAAGVVAGALVWLVFLSLMRLPG
jgi:hypothetical protein